MNDYYNIVIDIIDITFYAHILKTQIFHSSSNLFTSQNSYFGGTTLATYGISQNRNQIQNAGMTFHSCSNTGF